MMQSQDNLYMGINAHLMSFLQTPGVGATTSTFPSFHKDHITHIKDFLNDVLPPHYIALSEPSLQIQSREHLAAPFVRDSQPVPDIAIYHGTQHQAAASPLEVGAAPTMQLALTLPEPRPLTSVIIYEARTAHHAIHGTPVVRLEVLSPANMPSNSYAEVYQQNRTICLRAGTALVELDYLPEWPSPVVGVPPYPDDARARPYAITVSHPPVRHVNV
jgi:hypothetical protein